MTDIENIQASWVRLGAMFAVEPARRTPDIEKLILCTAEAIPGSARLCSMAVSWLARYHRLVCRHRLAAMIAANGRPPVGAVLGYVLSLAGRTAGADHYNGALKNCRPLASARPLFDAYRGNARLARIAREQSDPMALQWGFWSPPVRLYEDALRPGGWIMQENPSLRVRAIFGGSLAATVMVTLEEDSSAGRSELALARACGASRASLRDALDHLELCGMLTRRRRGRAMQIQLRPAFPFCARESSTKALELGA